jgi:uncharacterized protein (TIGR00251 family)
MPGDRKTLLPERQQEACRISVHVVPRSSVISIEKLRTAEYKVKIHTPPVEGAANRELIRLFSETLGIPRSQIQIQSGARSRTKILEIVGLSLDNVAGKITAKMQRRPRSS